MRRTLALALLVLALVPAQAALVNVALDAPAFANGPIVVNVTASLGAGTFAGRWVKLTSFGGLRKFYRLHCP